MLLSQCIRHRPAKSHTGAWGQCSGLALSPWLSLRSARAQAGDFAGPLNELRPFRGRIELGGALFAHGASLRPQGGMGGPQGDPLAHAELARPPAGIIGNGKPPSKSPWPGRGTQGRTRAMCVAPAMNPVHNAA